MKILYVHNVGLDSESANLVQVRAMCKAIAGIGCDVVLSLPYYASDSNQNTFNTDGYQISFRHRRKPQNKFVKYLSGNLVQKAIHDTKPDLIYVRNPLMLKQVNKFRIPIILELHNSMLHMGNRFLNYYWEFQLINMARKGLVSRIVCISKGLFDHWEQKGISREIMLTAHDGIDKEMFKNQISLCEARRLLSLPETDKIVSYIGRLYEDRKIDDIIELAVSFPQVYFVIVGGPKSQADKYRTIAKDREIVNIRFTGQIPHSETPIYMFGSDVLLALWSKDVPTINYCSPLKVFEYMASGKVIIAHGFPTIKEVLVNGFNAILIKPESYTDLKDNLQYALNFDSSLLGKNARISVFENYTWEKRAQKILEPFINRSCN